MAIAALVVGLASMVMVFVIPALVAIVLGVVALARIRKSGNAKTGRALAGIGAGLGVLSLLVTTTLVGVIVGSHMFEGHLTSYTNLRTGDCYNRPVLPSLYRVVPCSHRHDAEVASIENDPTAPGDPYPGRSALASEARTLCSSAAPRYVGAEIPAQFKVMFLYPTQTSWDNDGRTILCILASASNAKLTRPARGLA